MTDRAHAPALPRALASREPHAGAARGRGELRRAEVREHPHAARTVGASRKKMQMRKHGLQVPESIIGPFRAPLEKDSHWQTEFDPWLEGT